MKDKEIEEGNKVIAEFWFNESELNEGQQYTFHENWNALMPVVEKIEEMNNTVRIQDVVCDISIIGGNSISYWRKESPKILNTWKAVVEFIKWHNENNK